MPVRVYRGAAGGARRYFPRGMPVAQEELPLKVLCELGGWKGPQTVLRCYQQADAGQLWTALENRPRART